MVKAGALRKPGARKPAKGAGEGARAHARAKGRGGGEGFRLPHCPLLPPSHPDSCSALVIHWLPPPRLPNTTPIQFSPLPHPSDLIRPCTLQETYIKVRTVGDFAGQLEQGKEGAVQR